MGRLQPGIACFASGGDLPQHNPQFPSVQSGQISASPSTVMPISRQRFSINNRLCLTALAAKLHCPTLKLILIIRLLMSTWTLLSIIHAKTISSLLNSITTISSGNMVFLIRAMEVIVLCRFSVKRQKFISFRSSSRIFSWRWDMKPQTQGIVTSIHLVTVYSVSITGLIAKPKELFMKDVWKLPKYNATATLQCAGNKRTAMSKTRTVKGVGWDVVAIGNAEFILSGMFIILIRVVVWL